MCAPTSLGIGCYFFWDRRVSHPSPQILSSAAKLFSSSSIAKFDNSNGFEWAFMLRFPLALSPPESIGNPPLTSITPHSPWIGFPSRNSCPYPSSVDCFSLTPNAEIGSELHSWGSLNLHMTPQVKILTHEEDFLSFCIFLFWSTFELFIFSQRPLLCFYFCSSCNLIHILDSLVKRDSLNYFHYMIHTRKYKQQIWIWKARYYSLNNISFTSSSSTRDIWNSKMFFFPPMALHSSSRRKMTVPCWPPETSVDYKNLLE